MQAPHSLIAISLGTVIAFSSIGVASSQPSSRPTSPQSNATQSNQPEGASHSVVPGTASDSDTSIAQLSPEPTPRSPQFEPLPSGDTSTPASPAPSTAPEESSSPAPSTGESETPPTSGDTPVPGAGEEVINPMPSSEGSNTAGEEVTDPVPGSDESDRTKPLPTLSNATSAPEYLDPDPNPLSFPTQPEEVEIVGTQPITLRQVLELAQRNSRELQGAQLELDRARAQLREAIAANYPTLEAQVGATATLDPGREQQFTNALGQRTTVDQDDVTYTANGTLQLSYDVYTSGSRSASIRAARAQVRAAELALESTAEQLRLDATTDYYDLQQADEQVSISLSALEQAQRSLEDAQALERAGVGTRFDVLQAEVDVANSQQQLTQDRSDRDIARRQLVRRLNLGEAVDVAAAEPVARAGTWGLGLEESIVLAYRNRAELEQQLVQREISDQQRRAALAQLGPQVSVFAQFNVQDTHNDAVDPNSTYQVGAQVSLSLFDGGAARARARQQQANIALSEAQFADTRSRVRFEVEQAFSSLNANNTNITTAELALTQAEESLRLARLRFQAGVGTQSDVLRSQTELTRARFNRINAILSYNRSLVSLQRAVSNLPDSNLFEAP